MLSKPCLANHKELEAPVECMLHFYQSSRHFCSNSRIKWLSHLLMVLINSNQIQVVLLERAQAHNSQGSANLTAGTACTYGWACAHRKVKILTLLRRAANKWCCIICCRTLLVRLPYYCCVHMLHVNQGTVLKPDRPPHTAQFSACEPVHS